MRPLPAPCIIWTSIDLLIDYFNFARMNLRFLGFGTLLCFASSAGQTYFIGIFGPGIRAEFGLSHTEWGTLYLMGTLGSAILLPWSGQLLDRLDLRVFTVISLAGLTGACIAIAHVTDIWLIVGAIFLLRQFGQGLTSLTGATSMARYYNLHRGKALALSSMGYSLGEAILPLSAVVIVSLVGWRTAYEYTAVGVLLIIPIALWLLRGHAQRHRQHLTGLDDAQKDGGDTVSYTRREVLTEKRFYLITPALMLPAIIGTALFFHHLTLAEYKGWSAEWVTGNYWLYAVVTIATSLATGPLIDRYTAVRVMPLFLIPLAAALVVIGPTQSDFWLLPYMVLLGVNTGLFFTGSAALWAELYGPRYLGAIKSLMTALNVLGSAVGPVTVGLMLDNGVSMADVCLWFAIACLAFTLPLIQALKQ